MKAATCSRSAGDTVLDELAVKPALIALQQGARDSIAFTDCENVEHIHRLRTIVEDVAAHLSIDVVTRDHIRDDGRVELLVALADSPWMIWQHFGAEESPC